MDRSKDWPGPSKGSWQLCPNSQVNTARCVGLGSIRAAGNTVHACSLNPLPHPTCQRLSRPSLRPYPSHDAVVPSTPTLPKDSFGTCQYGQKQRLAWALKRQLAILPKLTSNSSTLCWPGLHQSSWQRSPRQIPAPFPTMPSSPTHSTTLSTRIPSAAHPHKTVDPLPSGNEQPPCFLLTLVEKSIHVNPNRRIH